MKYVKKKHQDEFDGCPNIHFSGSVSGMKKLGYWKKNDEIVRCGNYYYNLSAGRRNRTYAG